MAYTVSFGTTYKRRNSTSTVYAEVVSTSCMIKDACDFYNPTFTLQGQLNPACNYAYCAELASYYWIQSITFYGGQTTVICKRDAMATWKTNIGNATVYAVRLSVAPVSYTVDPLITSKGVATKQRYADSMGFDANGSYIVTVAGTGGHSLYACSPAQYATLYRNVYSPGFLTQNAMDWKSVADALTDVVFSVRNELINATDYIIGTHWIPYAIGGGNNPIYAGTFQVGEGSLVNAGSIVYSNSVTIPLPDNPQAANHGLWMNGPLGRAVMLTVPGIGDIRISTDGDPVSLETQISVDAYGTVTVSIQPNLRAGGKGGAYIRSGNIAVPVGASNGGSNIMGAVASMGEAVIAPTQLGNMAGIIATVNNIAGRPDTISTGGSRSLANSLPVFILETTLMQFNTIPFSQMGRIAQYTIAPKDAGGYIQAHDAHIVGPMTLEEKQEIESYMNGGFFYE